MRGTYKLCVVIPCNHGREGVDQKGNVLPRLVVMGGGSWKVECAGGGEQGQHRRAKEAEAAGQASHGLWSSRYGKATHESQASEGKTTGGWKRWLASVRENVENGGGCAAAVGPVTAANPISAKGWSGGRLDFL